MKKVFTIKCPQCKQPGEWREKNPYRPFCSERCKLIDFGAWAAEEHRITSETESDIIFSEDP